MSANMNISVNGAHNSIRNGLPCKYVVIILTEYDLYVLCTIGYMFYSIVCYFIFIFNAHKIHTSQILLICLPLKTKKT